MSPFMHIEVYEYLIVDLRETPNDLLDQETLVSFSFLVPRSSSLPKQEFLTYLGLGIACFDER